MTLNVAILGAGQAGSRHITGFAGIENVRITAVADANSDLARREADRCRATHFQDWQDALEASPAPDAVVVALPHHLHAEAACMAAGRGLHVLMEKPMGSTLAEGQRIEETCDAAGVVLMVCFVHRFRDEAIMAKAWIEAGHIGEPVNCLETIASPRGSHLGVWVNSLALSGGGALLYTGVHAVDRLLWLVDSPVDNVHAATRTLTTASQVEEAVAALLTFDNGAMATFSVTGPTYSAGGTEWRSEIYGTEGVIRIRARQSVEIAGRNLAQRIDVANTTAEEGEHYNFKRQAEAFVRAVRNQGVSPIPGQYGLRVLELCQKIYDRSRVSPNPTLP